MGKMETVNEKDPRVYMYERRMDVTALYNRPVTVTIRVLYRNSPRPTIRPRALNQNRDIVQSSFSVVTICKCNPNVFTITVTLSTSYLYYHPPKNDDYIPGI